MKLHVDVDSRFAQNFNHLLQVFLYVTDECNLRCVQCYYKPWLKRGLAEMETDTALALLETFRDLGAVKLSILGGEPTLYGRRGANQPLPAMVESARALGYQYIRVVSNGHFDASLLSDPRLRLIDELTISLDGDTPEIHDSVRGRGTFIRTVRNLTRAVDLGYRVHVTTCVHSGNVGRDSDGGYLMDRAIRWAIRAGASLVNFHPVIRMGIPRDAWTGTIHISPAEWSAAYAAIRSNISDSQYSIPVRLPQRFVTPGEFQSRHSYYGYCPVKIGERVEVHRNGQIHSCALNNGTPISLAKFSRDGDQLRIAWSTISSELQQYPFRRDRDHPCAIMTGSFNEAVPLCISFKPEQEEYIWKTTGLS